MDNKNKKLEIKIMKEEKINNVLIDYHQILREGIKRVIQSEESFQILVSSDDFSVVTQLLDSHSIDVLLIDIKIFMKHVEQIKQSIIEASPSMKVVVMSTEGEENFVTEAIRVGVHGYLLKEMDIFSFIDAIISVSKGTSYIHPTITHDLVEEYRKLSSEDEPNEEDTLVQCHYIYIQKENVKYSNSLQ